MKKLLIGFGLGIILVPSITFANSGFYLQGQGGVVTVTPDISDGVASFSLDPSAGATGRLSTGYLWGNNYFNYGLEAGVMYYPDTESGDFLGADTKYNGVNVDLLGVLKYTFNCGFNLFIKAGAAYMHQEATVTTEAFTIATPFGPVTVPATQISDNSGNKIAPEVGFGLGYQFNPNWEVNLALMSAITGSTTPVNSNPVATTTSLMLGVAYHFA